MLMRSGAGGTGFRVSNEGHALGFGRGSEGCGAGGGEGGIKRPTAIFDMQPMHPNCLSGLVLDVWRVKCTPIVCLAWYWTFGG